jgi:hypothetical protein
MHFGCRVYLLTYGSYYLSQNACCSAIFPGTFQTEWSFNVHNLHSILQEIAWEKKADSWREVTTLISECGARFEGEGKLQMQPA